MDQLIHELNKIKEILRTHNETTDWDESNTKFVLIIPILEAIGWQKNELDQMEFEFKVSSGSGTNRIDIVLKVHKEIKVCIEIKPLGSDLREKQEKQLESYCNLTKTTRLGALTDGQTWRFFECKNFLQIAEIDVINDDLAKLETTFDELINRETVERHDKHERRIKSRANAIRLERAWQDYIAKGQFNEIVKPIRKYAKFGQTKPDTEMIRQFLEAKLNDGEGAMQMQVPNDLPQEPIGSTPNVHQNLWHIFGQMTHIGSWKEGFFQFVVEAQKRDSNAVAKVVSVKPKWIVHEDAKKLVLEKPLIGKSKARIGGLTVI